MNEAEIRQQIEDGLDIGDYVDLQPDKSCIDGYFTAEGLRLIADAMDNIDAIRKGIQKPRCLYCGCILRKYRPQSHKKFCNADCRKAWHSEHPKTIRVFNILKSKE